MFGLSNATKKIVAVTLFVGAIGGLFAAFGDLGEGIGKAKHLFTSEQTQAQTSPEFPIYKTDWVTGGGGDRYCRPILNAYRAKYPAFDIHVTEPPGEHRRVDQGIFFKGDQYRYTCVFTAMPKKA